jgi:class 3 adenylate cyclase
VGAIAIRFPAAEIDRIMNFGNAWSKYGLGRTGETIVVGSDQVMRSNSRVLIEDPKRYESEVVAAGTPLPVAQRAVRLKSTILVQPVGPAGAQLVGGKPGTLTAEDYLGKTSLQAYTPINLRDLEWTVIAKIDTAEAFAPVTTFTRRVVLSAVALIFLVCLASLFLARYLVRPVRELEEGTRKVAAGELGTTVDIASNDEFGDLATAFNDMSRTLEVKEQLLQEQRAENDRLLLQMMPGTVAERYRAGESTIYSEHDDVTVLFAEFDGLDDLVTEMGSQPAMEFLNQLVREFDGAAERLGVEKVRTMRNGYLASCGLTIPRLDNARRTVDFAIEMEEITARLGADSSVHIGVRVGIDTGTVTSGIVGRTALAFDMWGAAVNLAQSAGHGGRSPGVYVTDRVRHSLGESEEFEPAGSVDASGTSTGVWRLREGAQ